MIVNSILFVLFGWLISFIIWFILEWLSFPNDDKTVKSVLKWMSLLEYLPLINMFLLTSIILILLIGLLYLVIIDPLKKICKKFG
jgi:hypothetical protein